MVFFRQRPFLSMGFVIAAFLAVIGVVLAAAGPRKLVQQTAAAAEPIPAGEDEGGEERAAVTVRTIKPRRDASLTMTAESPAYVEAYYRADLQARAAGQVKYIQKDKGDTVTEGERLVELDVPDLKADRDAKNNIVGQREKEWLLAKSRVIAAEAAVRTAKSNVKEKESLLDQAKARTKYCRENYKRLADLRASKSVEQVVVDVAIREMEYAQASELAATAAIDKAKSEVEDAEGKLEVAKADVEEKKQLIEVAKADSEKSAALYDYATIRAPFDGVIVRREVDPGSFVHNAATTQTKPVLSVERTDIVTIYMKLPDNYAPFVTQNTEAIVEMTELPNLQIRGKVTRFAPSLQNPEHDRTMRVEVDLYNSSRENFERFVAKEQRIGRADLKGALMPLFPVITGMEDATRPNLLPGMYGTMRLVLRKFDKAFLLPSNVLVSQGGKSFFYEVKNNTVHLVPVSVQIDDGTLAKVTRLVKVGSKQVSQELTGQEEIVLSNQGELSDGQTVKAIPSEPAEE